MRGRDSRSATIAYRYKYDRPPVRDGLRYRLQRTHLRSCAARGARFSSVTARNLAEGAIVEERYDDHGCQNHVDDVADCRDGVDVGHTCPLCHGFCAFILALVCGEDVFVALEGNFGDGMACVGNCSCWGVEFLLRRHTGTAFVESGG